jgi:hypothetical protein
MKKTVYTSSRYPKKLILKNMATLSGSVLYEMIDEDGVQVVLPRDAVVAGEVEGVVGRFGFPSPEVKKKRKRKSKPVSDRTKVSSVIRYFCDLHELTLVRSISEILCREGVDES